MSYGPRTVFTVAVTSGTTLSAELNLGRVWDNVYLDIPSLTTSYQHWIQASDVTGGTFRRVYHPMPNSATVLTNVFAIASAVTNAVIPIPNGIQYLKIELDTASTNGTTYKVICSSQ